MDPQEEARATCFAQVVDHALRMLGGDGGTTISTQKELARWMGVSETMIHRYRSKRVDFLHLKAHTVHRLAEGLSVARRRRLCLGA